MGSIQPTWKYIIGEVLHVIGHNIDLSDIHLLETTEKRIGQSQQRSI